MLKDLAVAMRTDHELRREAFSMSLYVSIVLLSALTVFDEDHPPERGEVLLVELGTTVGLVLAHWFASWVSTRLIGDPTTDADPWGLLRVQLAGALGVALLAVLAAVLAPTAVELQASRLTVAATIGALVFLESRSTNSGMRAAAYGLLALAAGVTVATVKAALSH